MKLEIYPKNKDLVKTTNIVEHVTELTHGIRISGKRDDNVVNEILFEDTNLIILDGETIYLDKDHLKEQVEEIIEYIKILNNIEFKELFNSLLNLGKEE